MLYPPAILPRQVTNMAAPPLQAQAIQSMVPPPPDPTLPPEAAQTKHAERGAMILTALKQLGAMGQQQQAVNPSDLMPDIGGAKGAGFLGSKIVQTKQEQQLRANMAAAQMNQQQQRDLMQQSQQEQARADQIGYQETKLKNDMKLKKMEMDQKKQDQDYERNKPENRVKALEAELKIDAIMSGMPNLSEDQKLRIKKDFTTLVQGGTPMNDALALYGEYGLIPKGLNIATKASQRAGRSGGADAGGVGKTELDTLTQGQWNLIVDHPELAASLKISPEGAAIIKASGKMGASGGGGQEDDIGVTQYKTITDAMTALEADIATNTPTEDGYIFSGKKDTPEMKATREALQKKKDILEKRKNQFLYGASDPTGAAPAPVAQAPQGTGDPDVDAAIAQGGKVVVEGGQKFIVMPDGRKGLIQ